MAQIKTFSVTPILNHINSTRVTNPHLIVAMVIPPARMYGNFNRVGKEWNIGHCMVRGFTLFLKINDDENGPKA